MKIGYLYHIVNTLALIFLGLCAYTQIFEYGYIAVPLLAVSMWGDIKVNTLFVEVRRLQHAGEYPPIKQ